MHDLGEHHKAHLLPGFHDRDDEEHAIEVLTSEITKVCYYIDSKQLINSADVPQSTKNDKSYWKRSC